MKSDYEARVRRLRQRMQRDNGPRAILVSNPVNVTYLTGFTGDSSYLLVTHKSAVIVSDARYEAQIAEECPQVNAEIRTPRHTTLQWVAQVVQQSKLAELAIEANTVTLAEFSALQQAMKSTELVPTTSWIEELRAVKDAGELQRIERSIAINERAFEVIRAQLRGDQTEREIAYNLEHQMRAFGATQGAFRPIVGVGPRAALPHAVLSNRRVADDPFLLLDWGAVVDGYCSDLTRMLITGKPPPRLEKVYRVVLQAQQAAIDTIRPGATFQEVDAAAREVIAEAGFGKRFGHGLGHGFGLQIHEYPFVAPAREGTLQENMVLTVEPGIYLTGVLGVRIEDDVVVTAEGCRLLSRLHRDFESCFAPI